MMAGSRMFPVLLFGIIFAFAFLSMHRLIEWHKLRTLESVSSKLILVLNGVRDFYSEEVVSNISTDLVEVSHNYIGRDGTIPIPASFSIDFTKYISASNRDLDVYVTSNFPFPWRENFRKTEFQTEALGKLTVATDNSYYWSVTKDSVDEFFNFSSPIIMRESCVDCHNSHPASPKTNWKVGDVRGIIGVRIPSDTYIASLPTLMFPFLGISMLGFLITVGYSFGLFKRRKTPDDLNGEASISVENSDGVSPANDILQMFLFEVNQDLDFVKKSFNFSENASRQESQRYGLRESAMKRFDDLESLITNFSSWRPFERDEKGLLLPSESLETFSFKRLLQEVISDLESNLLTSSEVKIDSQLVSSVPALVSGNRNVLKRLISNYIKFRVVSYSSRNFLISASGVTNRDDFSGSDLLVDLCISDDGVPFEDEVKARVLDSDFVPGLRAPTNLTYHYGSSAYGVINHLIRLVKVLRGSLEIWGETNREGDDFGIGENFRVTIPVRSVDF